MPKKITPKAENPIQTQLMLVLGLVVIAIFLLTLKSSMPVTPSVITPAPTDLNGTTTELNSIDVDQIDTGLNQLNIETSAF